jgi:hypothetical protein
MRTGVKAGLIKVIGILEHCAGRCGRGERRWREGQTGYGCKFAGNNFRKF